jgi:hypothetical protein
MIIKKTFRTFVVALAFSALCPVLHAQSAGSLGAGVVIGEPLGLTGKYWFDGIRAVDAGVGFGGGDSVLYADFLWHAWDIVPQPAQGKLGLYVSAGPRLEFESNHDENSDARFGIRTLVGADYWIQNRPIEVFLEAGPVFQFSPTTAVDIDAGLGIRFYFGRSR